MVDFLGAFIVLSILVVLIIIGSVIFFVVKIFHKAFDKMKREKHARIISHVADEILYNQENRSTERVKMPKDMKVTKENNETIIYYKKLAYNINQGRYLENV